MKTLGILAILVVVVGGFFLWARGGNEPMPTEVPNEQIDVTQGEVSGEQVPIDTEASKVEWRGSKTLVLNYEDNGTVDIKEGYVVESDGDIVGGMFVADMTTITALSTGRGSDEDKLTTHLKSEDFFNVATYPESTFVIRGIEERSDLAAENSTHLVTGDLIIKGITNTISIPANISEDENGNWDIVTLFDIDRTKWGIRYGSGSFFDDLGDNVIDDMIRFNVHLVSEARVTN